MELDHIGIAVQSIEQARGFYEAGLGLRAEPQIEEVAGEKVRVLKLIVPPGTHIELIESTNSDSAIAKYIEKRGPGLHHLCYAVDDIESATRRMIEQGYQPIWESARQGAGGCLVNFFHPKQTHGVLTELSQRPN
ncbi:MAG: methylmalonyl-CoA epimerase [Planctomycetes bacterium]|nr:methylmalonyl-CoA epimerase [Planctomycetota bacterium]MCB9934717.1 methylmalonyl-CoA epimerase [Planctomycetota bacterium]